MGAQQGSAAGTGDVGDVDASQPSTDFGNPDDPDASGAALDAAMPKAIDPNSCMPGKYVGTYKCMLEMNGMPSIPLEGSVAFDLAITQTKTQDCAATNEFCFDLVIDKGSGKLFGFAVGFFGFETSLEGGLNCQTGEFQAKGVDGIWGFPMSTNPSDPNAPLTVAKPPSGTFDGEMEGMHVAGPPQKIEGTWLLHESAMMLSCPGPFTVERKP